MLVALPYCAKDAALAEKNLQWCLKLGKHTKQRCVLIHEIGARIDAIHDLAELYFEGGIQAFKYDKYDGDLSWPHPQNYVFRRFVRWMSIHCQDKESFFWWEADCTPLKADWVDQLEDAHKEGGKPFMGHIVPVMGHMTGCGVYPPNAADYSTNMLRAPDVPFDVACATDMSVPDFVCQRNDLIQHVWSIGGHPPTFPDKATAGALVNKTSVVFHRCKDGSLIDALSGFSFKRLFPQKTKKADEGGTSVALVQLMRNGDIISLLPAVEILSKRHNQKIAVVTGSEFAGILDGVSYAYADPWSGSSQDYQGAVEYAKGKYETVYTPGVYGRGVQFNACRQSFCVEAWGFIRMLPDFYKKTMALNFDNRNSAVEKKLLREIRGPKKKRPLLAVNFAALTCPIAHVDNLLADLHSRFGRDADIVELDKVKTTRIYDLLGIMDDANCILTIDTATLHLCAATKTPAIQLINSNPLWLGSHPKGNCVMAVRYNDLYARWNDVCDMIRFKLKLGFAKVAHVFSGWVPNDAEGKRRHKFARTTWEPVYAKQDIDSFPVHDDELPRIFKDGAREFPYIKDMIEAAFNKGYQTIVLTNGDTCFSPALEKMDLANSFLYSTRRDFSTKIDQLKTVEEIRQEVAYAGADLWVFSRDWWYKRRDMFPDMILASAGWDTIMCELMKLDKAKAFDDLIYHEKHSTQWESDKGLRHNTTHNNYNIQLARHWYLSNEVKCEAPNIF